MSYRRVYINTAEAVRVSGLNKSEKIIVANSIAAKLTEGEGAPSFDRDRFVAHCMSDSDTKPEYVEVSAQDAPDDDDEEAAAE